MDRDASRLRRKLKRAGFGERAIDAAWPGWWSDEAAQSPSALVELRFTLARRLGLAPKSLIDDRVDFVWRDDARFKHLSQEYDAWRAPLASFGAVVGRLLVTAAPSGISLEDAMARNIRADILASSSFVDLRSMLALCWGVGIPVVHLQVFPLSAKRMHAMVVSVKGCHAILLGRDASYPAYVAFDLAHELAHIALRHLGEASALVDFEDPLRAKDCDSEEVDADRFALMLLTGSEAPDVRTNVRRFGPKQLAAAALEEGPKRGIEPGTLALCYAHRSGEWAKATAAMRHIYDGPKPVWREVNGIASSQIDWLALSDDSREYLQIILGLKDA